MEFERIDTWVVRAAIMVPVLCVGGLLLWHLVGYLAGTVAKKNRVGRLSPEPAAPFAPAAAENADPEALERACAAKAESLAEMYLKLAELWRRLGEAQRATAALRKLIERCPDTPQAKIGRERLEQITAIKKPE